MLMAPSNAVAAPSLHGERHREDDDPHYHTETEVCRFGTVLDAAFLINSSSHSPGLAYDTLTLPMPSDAAAGAWRAPCRHRHHEMAADTGPSKVSGIVVCYSGLLRGFPFDGTLSNHKRFLAALHARTPRVALTIILALYDGNATETHRVLDLTQAAFAPHEVVRVSTAPDRSAIHPQFQGIATCGRTIRELERRNRRRFAFAVRTRYDLEVSGPAIMSVPLWPLWRPPAPPQPRSVTGMVPTLIGFAKQRRRRRCLPQDVWFAVRADRSLGDSVACAFEADYTAYRRFDATYPGPDRLEAVTYAPVWERGLPFTVLWETASGGGNCSQGGGACGVATAAETRCCGRLWRIGDRSVAG